MNAHPALLGRGDRLSGLCQLVSDFNGKVPNGGAIAEPKIDGIRMLWIDGELVTREGAPILGVDHIVAGLRHLEHRECVPMFLDGEWQVEGSFDATLRHFNAKGALGDAGVFHVFDAMTMRQWRGQDVGQALSGRKAKLKEMLEPLGNDGISELPWGWIETAEDAYRLACEVIGKGGEGVIIKHATATYRAGRSTNWMRIKKTATYDCRIVDTIVHKDHPDWLGVMVCDLEGVAVRVPVGFTDQERFDLWQRREAIIGQIAEIEAMERTETGKLRQARFLRLRGDRL